MKLIAKLAVASPFPSLPLWERGLKYSVSLYIQYLPESLPLWERGLKFVGKSCELAEGVVAPLVGAWIEIPLCRHNFHPVPVAPLVGAWIEI